MARLLPSLSEVRTFKITGEIKKGQTRIPFAVEISALKEEHAMQRLYAEMGSRHRARRFEITIESVEEVKSKAEAVQNVSHSSK
jgi:large subunit ribosomal protein LX